MLRQALVGVVIGVLLVACPYSGYDDDDSGPEPETFVEATTATIRYAYQVNGEHLCLVTYPLSYNINLEAVEAPYPDEPVTAAWALSFDLDLSSECFMSGEADYTAWANFFDVYLALDGTRVLLWDEVQGWQYYIDVNSSSDAGFSTWGMVDEDGEVSLWEQITVSW